MSRIGSEPYIKSDPFLNAINHISNLQTVDEMSPLMESLITFRSASYHYLPSVGAADYDQLGRYWAKNIPEIVLRHFESKRSLNDSLKNYVMGKGRPFWISKLRDEADFQHEAIIERMNSALEYLGDGILLPLFGPFNKQAYSYVSFHHPTAFYDDVFIWQIHALSQAMHARYCIILNSLSATIHLTPRETEVLELIKFGKTNPEIARILGISPNTVTGYVKQIFLKLNVTDRVTAALRSQTYQITAR